MLEHAIEQREVELLRRKIKVADLLDGCNHARRNTIVKAVVGEAESGNLERYGVDINARDSSSGGRLCQNNGGTTGTTPEIEDVKIAQVGERQDVGQEALAKRYHSSPHVVIDPSGIIGQAAATRVQGFNPGEKLVTIFDRIRQVGVVWLA